MLGWLQRTPAKMKDLHWIMTCSSRCSSLKGAKPDVQPGTTTRLPETTYEEAIQELNNLQSNASAISNARKSLNKDMSHIIPEGRLFAKRAGLTTEAINKLPIIHVSGTKGKGSVCAFCESILRKHGLKTGFFSSPHLVEVRERIRINGVPLEKEDFVTSFYEVFNKLEATKPDYNNVMPAYFRFLTFMALHVFIKEEVDVALLEVGIGGEYDCTNIIENPTVVGITSLGMDHQGMLGDTIDKIAWHKAGICKPERPAFTVPQPYNALKTVLDRANELQSVIQCVPTLEYNSFSGHPIQLGLAGDHQRVNASLAVHLCKKFLQVQRKEKFEAISTNGNMTPRRLRPTDTTNETVMQAHEIGMSIAEPIVLPESFIAGLRDCYWAGRTQRFRHDRVTYYIDGAHTTRSIHACRNWFLQEADQRANSNIARILIFNSTGGRDSLRFLEILLDCQFDGVVFCPNLISAYDGAHNPLDSSYKHQSSRSPLYRLHHLQQEFEALQVRASSTELVNGHGHSGVTPLPGTGTRAKCAVVPSITDALQWAACGKDSNLSSPRIEDPTPPDAAISAARIEVLVTGSIHLVGGVIKVLDPELVVHR